MPTSSLYYLLFIIYFNRGLNSYCERAKLEMIKNNVFSEVFYKNQMSP